MTSTTIGNSVTTIGQEAFYKCSGLTTLAIPNSVESINFRSFSGCTSLTSVTIGNSVTTIDYGAFEGCTSLISVHLGNSLLSIGPLAFSGCVGLTSITLPPRISTISYLAFENCWSLSSITIPNSVTSIGLNAFGGVDFSNIVSLVENPFGIKGKSSNARTFSENTYNNAILYVPKGTKEKYESTEGWKDFLYIEEGSPSSITNIESEDTKEYKRYTLDGRVVKNSRKGINLIQMNNGSTKKVLVK